jgi:hypothetical protein
MNNHTFLNFEKPYFTFNREERNLAAIFYHALLINNNLEKFLAKLNSDYPIVFEETGIYLEYAALRDIWFNIDKKDSNRKRSFILNFLQLENNDYLKNCSISEFNSFFGGKSNDEIENPGNWSITKFSVNFTNDVEFLEVCKFKWCFNAKPDIVIHTSNKHAICIEAKFESGESNYPANGLDTKVFNSRGIFKKVRQTEIQKKLMEEILGLQCKFYFLVQNPQKSASHETILWKDAFGGIDLTGCPYFVEKWIAKFQ